MGLLSFKKLSAEESEILRQKKKKQRERRFVQEKERLDKKIELEKRRAKLHQYKKQGGGSGWERAANIMTGVGDGLISAPQQRSTSVPKKRKITRNTSGKRKPKVKIIYRTKSQKKSGGKGLDGYYV